jgi:hypothetical protein
MINEIFPTTVVDGFYSIPEQVVEFANQQEYNKDLNNKWPGKRTNCLSTINYNFYDSTIKKMLALYYPENHDYRYEASMYFQKIHNSFVEGWVHTDSRETLVIGIIYLNEKYNPNAGTSIYQTSKLGVRCVHTDKKAQIAEGGIDEYRKENNDQFEEVIALKNKFNRLVLFDAHQYHAAQSFADTEERLTIVVFLKKLAVDRYPIQRCHRVL